MDNLIQILSTGTASIEVWLIIFLASFAGGILASISPCSLAMLPLIIGYVGGYSKETPIRTFVQLSFFIIGTAIIFTIIGTICALTGSVFASALGGYFTIIMASLLLIMGLKIIGIIEFELPILVKTMPSNSNNSLILYPILIGMIFALAGTPCSTPILAGILTFAAMGKSLIAAIIMLFLFAIGQGLILLIAGLFTSSLKNMKKFASFSNALMKISGVLLIIVSAYLYYKTFLPIL